MPLTSPSDPAVAAVASTAGEPGDSPEEPPGPEQGDPVVLREPVPAADDGDLIASPLGAIGGMAIALLTLAVPFASVVMDREQPAPAGFPTSMRR